MEAILRAYYEPYLEVVTPGRHDMTGDGWGDGGVLTPGRMSPKLISREILRAMRPGSAFVDVGIDQGGISVTSRPTSHSAPVYVEEGVVHYCVTNMPGGVPRTSTLALNNATLPFVLKLADRGWQRALTEDEHLRNGLNVCNGRLTCQPVADALDITFTDPLACLG